MRQLGLDLSVNHPDVVGRGAGCGMGRHALLQPAREFHQRHAVATHGVAEAAYLSRVLHCLQRRDGRRRGDDVAPHLFV